MKVLFATSEVQPLIRSGGLAEVSWGLARALRDLGHDLRLILPGYPPALRSVKGLETVARINLLSAPEPVRLLLGTLPDSDIPIYLVDSPVHFAREGGPYANADGDEWADNAERFAAFCRIIAGLASAPGTDDWQPELVHCNDWQTGLVPALLAHEPAPPATLFTIHNLAAQGLFSWEVFHRLALPRPLWTRHGLEHYGNFSFVKGGLAFSDRINTVSPTYAREIQTEAQGCGLEDVLRRHSERLAGILNGVDYTLWNPDIDPHIPVRYNRDSIAGKQSDKSELQRRLDLPIDPEQMLFVHNGRLLERRGADLLLELVPELKRLNAQLVVMGQGDRALEQAWGNMARRHPDRTAVVIGNDEPLHHLMVAAADAMITPSRFEPCGLDPLHGMRYGAVPVVHETGGLADSVVDVGPDRVMVPNATGFCFEGILPSPMIEAIERACTVFRRTPRDWHLLVRNGMERDFSWPHSARRYEALYLEAIQHHQEFGS